MGLTGEQPQLETLLLMGHSADHKHQKEERTRGGKERVLVEVTETPCKLVPPRGRTGQLKDNKSVNEKVSAYR